MYLTALSYQATIETAHHAQLTIIGVLVLTNVFHQLLDVPVQ
jgi:hypothetical protein